MHGEDERARQRTMLEGTILDYWNRSYQTYGAPRSTADLHDEGIAINVKTVAKVMRALGIEGMNPRAFTPVTTIADKPSHNIPDRVKRLFHTGRA